MVKNRFKIAVWSALFLIGVTTAIPSYTQNNQETRFDSTLELKVYESREGEAPKLLGRTPTKDTGVLIPAGVDWYVQPININLTDEDFYALVAELKQRSIPGLALFGCDQITDAGLAHLTELKELTKLNLGFTKITDAGLAHLTELKGLTSLDLSLTQITDAGLKELRSALPKCDISQ